LMLSALNLPRARKSSDIVVTSCHKDLRQLNF